MKDKLQNLIDEERILRELGKKKELGIVLGSQAEILASMGKSPDAMLKLSEAEALFREIDFIFGIEKTLFNQVNLLEQSSEPKKLFMVLQRQEELFRKSNNNEDLAECLFSQMSVAHQLGDLRKETELSEIQIPIWQELDNSERVAFCYGNSAMSLMRLNENLDKALYMASQSEKVCRNMDEPALLARSLNTKAFVLSKMKRNREALEACSESMRISKEKGISQWIGLNKPLLRQLVRDQIISTVTLLPQDPIKAKQAWKEIEAAAIFLDDVEISTEIIKLKPLFIAINSKTESIWKFWKR